MHVSRTLRASRRSPGRFPCLGDLIPACPIRTLRAFSAFGTSLAFYHKEKGKVTQPPTILPPRGYETNVAPTKWWRYDILRAEGAEFFREQVNVIKEECARIEAWSVIRSF